MPTTIPTARAPAALLRRSTVLPACSEHGALEGDVARLGQFFDVAHEVHIGDEAAVADVQAKAFAEPRGREVFRHAGRVTGQRRVDAKADVGLHLIGRRARAAQADFFLTGEGHMNLRATPLIGQLADRLDPQPAGHAVVERFGDELLTHLKERLVHDDEVTDLDDLLRLLAQPEVDEEFRDFGDLLAVFGEEM